MPGPPPAVAACRVAVRRALAAVPPSLGGARGLVLAGVSGGGDSLALAAALSFEAPRAGLAAGALVVDHGLQPGSAQVAEHAAQQCRDLGLEPVEVLTVVVVDDGGGPESAARDARYAALESARQRRGADRLLLGHTRDDQAEQVLLGLVRGSGTRSLSGMPGATATLLRPLLALTGAQTRAACAELGLTVWEDPHNRDPRYLRVRVRALLDDLERGLGPGVRAGLARSADLLRVDGEALDQAAHAASADLLDAAAGPAVDALADLPTAIRTRVLRRLLLIAGADPAALSSAHIGGVDALVTHWRGQGAVDIPGGLRARRRDGRIVVEGRRRVE